MAEGFLERLKSEVLVCDGAMGTMLQARGLTGGACPELWNKNHPERVQEVHRAYFAAGCNMVETNTFGGNRLKLKGYGLEKDVADLNYLGARLAREVCPPGCFVCGSVGPTGHFLEPLGDVSREEIYDVFKEQILALAEGGADVICIETMMDTEEAAIAVRVAKENTDLPVIATMTFELDRNGYRTMMGIDPVTAARRLTEAGADVIGCNCVNGPEIALGVLQEMKPVTDRYLMAQPNAGLPQLIKGETVFELGPEVYAQKYPVLLEVRPHIVGGCCGTTPEHLAFVVKLVKGINS
ncbi:MAG: homocysteine S-methyltransferase family protein [candidate division NC10 bacterium]|nr:homocysteine S-methyltransferase family protein [candidate division NC10 bacterium]